MKSAWDRLAELSHVVGAGRQAAAWIVPAEALAWLTNDLRELNPEAPIVYLGSPIIEGPGWGLLMELAA